jgi:hypothetical protein
MFLFCCHGFAPSACPEIDSESHFHKVFENETARVFTLELERLESTASYCPKYPYFYLVTTEGETTDTKVGHAGWSHRWNSGEARFIAEPAQHTIRNDSATVHRAIIVEILSKLEFIPLRSNIQGDDFAGDLGSAKATWTISVGHGPMSAAKTQIGAGDKVEVRGRTRVVIALDDLALQTPHSDLSLPAQGVKVISPESDFSLTNSGRFPAKLVSIAF